MMNYRINLLPLHIFYNQTMLLYMSLLLFIDKNMAAKMRSNAKGRIKEKDVKD